MDKVRWARKTAFHFIILEPTKEVRELNSFVAILLFFAVVCFVLLGIMYCLAFVGFLIKDALVAPSPDIASTQVYIDKSYSKHSGYMEFRTYGSERTLAQNKVCRSFMRELPHPGSLDCVRPDGVGRERIFAEKSKSISCCIRAIDRQSAPVLYYQRWENIKRWTSPLWIMPFIYLCLCFAGGTLITILGGSFAFIVVPLTFIKSSIRGIRNTYLAIKLPKLMHLDQRDDIHGQPFLVQLSDLHLTAPGKKPVELQVLGNKWREDFGIPDSEFLSQRTRELVKKAASINPKLIIITGDITDQGLNEEWEVFSEICKSSVEILAGQRISMIAGNHDINFNLADKPDANLSNLWHRNYRFSEAQRQMSTIFGPGLDDVQGVGVSKISVDHECTNHFNVIALDTNKYKSRNAFSGALGLIGEEQLRAVSDLLNKFEGPLLIAMHHHFGVPKGLTKNIEDLWLVTIDADRLLGLLEDYAERAPSNKVLIIHGHRHRLYRSTTISRKVMVFGLGSSTMGTEIEVVSDSGKKRVELDGIGVISVIGMSKTGNWSVRVENIG